MRLPLQRIGVLTAGGDCPGLNAVIRAVTKTAIVRHGMEVVGIKDGYLGLIENRTTPLTYEDVSGILTLGGTILGPPTRLIPSTFSAPAALQWSPRMSHTGWSGMCADSTSVPWCASVVMAP